MKGLLDKNIIIVPVFQLEHTQELLLGINKRQC